MVQAGLAGISALVGFYVGADFTKSQFTHERSIARYDAFVWLTADLQTNKDYIASNILRTKDMKEWSSNATAVLPLHRVNMDALKYIATTMGRSSFSSFNAYRKVLRVKYDFATINLVVEDLENLRIARLGKDNKVVLASANNLEIFSKEILQKIEDALNTSRKERDRHLAEARQIEKKLIMKLMGSAPLEIQTGK